MYLTNRTKPYANKKEREDSPGIHTGKQIQIVCARKIEGPGGRGEKKSRPGSPIGISSFFSYDSDVLLPQPTIAK